MNQGLAGTPGHMPAIPRIGLLTADDLQRVMQANSSTRKVSADG